MLCVIQTTTNVNTLVLFPEKCFQCKNEKYKLIFHRYKISHQKNDSNNGTKYKSIYCLFDNKETTSLFVST